MGNPSIGMINEGHLTQFFNNPENVSETDSLSTAELLFSLQGQMENAQMVGLISNSIKLEHDMNQSVIDNFRK